MLTPEEMIQIEKNVKNFLEITKQKIQNIKNVWKKRENIGKRNGHKEK